MLTAGYDAVGQAGASSVSCANTVDTSASTPLFRVTWLKLRQVSVKYVSVLRSELRTLQTLKDKGFPWAPRCRGHSLSFDNAVRHPFIVLTWIDGTALRLDENVPEWARDRVLAQMAAIQVSLIECTQQNGTYQSFL